MMDRQTPTDDAALQAQARGWIRRLKAGNATAQDAQAFRQWCRRSDRHRQALARARADWQDLDEVVAVYRSRHGVQPEGRDTWNGSGLRQPARRRLMGGALLSGGAACTAAGLWFPPFGLWPSWRELNADFRTRVGEQREIALAQDIVLLLNTRTSMMVDVVPQGGRQLTLLQGEAAVRRTHPSADVLLRVGAGRVEVGVGTTGVRSDLKQVCVTCIQGMARVRHPQGTLELQAGQQVVYDDLGLGGVDAAANAEALALWPQGIVVFRETPMAQAVEEINRYRAGRVVLMGNRLAERRLSGRFRIAELDAVVRQLPLIVGADLTALPGGVVVLS